MPDSPTSPASEGSHESGDERRDSSSKTPALKDKECPYCHQHFTSSSLGRHLDQYLQKKKPDGIHDVDEIRKRRGGITRRTARNSKKDQHDTDSSARPSPAAQLQAQHIPPIHEALPSFGDLNYAPPGGSKSRFNHLNWHTTGVITDPNMLNSHRSLAAPNTASNTIYRPASPTANNKKRSFTTYANDLTPNTLSDTTRALELSLREVLDALRAANKHISVPPTPFPFDFTSQTFPSLILHLLPTPPTLHQTSPFSTLTTTPISAPGPDQLPPLRAQVINKIDMWKWHALRLAQRTTSNIADEADFLGRQAESYTASVLSHLNTAYENWMTHPPEIRDLLWHIELLRAFQDQKDKVEQLEEKMDELQQEANQLQQQVEYLSQCQWPREMALWPPERRTFPRKMREELRLVNLQKPIPGPGGERDRAGGGSEMGEDGVDPSVQTENINVRGDKDKWDFDKLVGKWRAHVKEDRQRRTPFVQSTSGGGGVAASGAGGGTGGTGLHWLGESNKTTTPAELRRGKNEGERNGTNGGMGSGAGGSGSPALGNGSNEHVDKRAISGDGVRKKISIISDWGGD